jgi:hypothetical protein
VSTPTRVQHPDTSGSVPSGILAKDVASKEIGMLSRRTLLRSSVGASISVAGLVAWPSRGHAVGTNLIGYTAAGTQSCEQLDVLTARRAQVVRVYHREGTPVPGSLQEAGRLLTYLRDQGRQVVYSLKVPDSSSQTMTACEALAADIARSGYSDRIWIILWHEPYPELSATAYVARYRALAPSIRRHGVRCGVCFHTYPIWHKDLDYTTYWPGDDLTDFLAIDTYPSDAPGGQGLSADPLATISPLTSFAKGRGKTFGIAEYAIPAQEAAAQPTTALAWIDKFQRLGGSCRFVTYWNGDPMGLEQNDGLLVPAYQRLYDHFAGN